MIRSGQLVAVTTPSEAREAIDGDIYEGTVAADGFDAMRASHCVTQAYLVEGKNRVRVYQPEGSPPEGFVPVASTLEDTYLVLMRGRMPKLTNSDMLEIAVPIKGGAFQ